MSNCVDCRYDKSKKSSSSVHLSYARGTSSGEEDEELAIGLVSSARSGDDDDEEFCEVLAWIAIVASLGLGG